MKAANGRRVNGAEAPEWTSPEQIDREQGRSSNGSVPPLSLERSALTRRTGLYLHPKLSLTTWQRIGRQMYLITDSSAWWWGDWLVFGEDRYPDRYRRALTETSLEYQTLRNYAWVARRFPASRRRDKLSFQHHVVVAALDDDAQEFWLSRAEEHGWSRNELRRRIREERTASAGQSGDGPDEAVVLQLNVSRDRQHRWQEAATQANEDMTDWIMLSLDRLADALLDSGRERGSVRSTEMPIITPQTGTSHES
jgi:hypothetical protein